MAKLIDVLTANIEGRLLVSQEDPYADHLVAIKRAKAADPCLIPEGTTGLAIACWVYGLLDKWMADWSDGTQTLEAVMLEIDDEEFTYAPG